MYVGDYMTPNPITISKKTGIFEALQIMKNYKIRQLPVVSEGKLAGLVTEKDLLTVSPSTTTSLSVHELSYLLAKMTVAEVMVKNPLTATPKTTIDEAAMIMREHKVNSLPVVDGDKLVGIITVTDIFDALIKFFGYGKTGTRLVITSREGPGLLCLITSIIKETGAPVSSIICDVKEDETAQVMLRLKASDPKDLMDALKGAGIEVTWVKLA